MERERKRISIIEHNSLKIIFCLINCGQSTNNNLNDTLVTNENKQMYMAKKKKGNTYCGNRNNLVILLWWVSPSWAQTSLKLPNRTSNLSSRRILLACTSLQLKKRTKEMCQKLAPSVTWGTSMIHLRLWIITIIHIL